MRVVERHQIGGPPPPTSAALFQGYMPYAAASFHVVAASMFHQNAPHQLGRPREKMRSILPLHALVIHQANVGFVYQGRRLQAVAGAFASHVAARQAAEFVIDDGGQPLERGSFSVAPGSEQAAHVPMIADPAPCLPAALSSP